MVTLTACMMNVRRMFRNTGSLSKILVPKVSDLWIADAKHRGANNIEIRSLAHQWMEEYAPA